MPGRPHVAEIARAVLAVLFLCACGNDGRRVDPSGDGSTNLTDGDAGVQLDGIAACTACSSDLHSVVDCSGNLVTACPAGQGCSPTLGCIPACDAAAENRTAIGCEYYAPTPPDIMSGPTCYAAFVANTWGEPITIRVDRAGATLDVDTFGALPVGGGQGITYTPLVGGQLAADSVAILFLSDDGASCPGSGTAVKHAGFMGTNYGDAFHITTSAPVVVYDIYPYGGGSGATTSATLLQPTSAWDTTFVAVTMPETSQFGPPWIGFVAGSDATHVMIKPPVAVVGGNGVAGGAAGATLSYTVDKGRFLKLEQDADLTGTTVVSDKPIALFGGNALANLPSDQIAADCMHQQIPPVRAFGSRYAAVRYRNRIPIDMEEAPPWTIVGVVDGTTLTYDPPNAALPATVAGGQVLRFPATGPFVVSSQDAQHPFYFAQHMTGCGVNGGYGSILGCAGDPEWVNVVPPAQYLARYVFFTDPTYPTTDLVFVRERGTSGDYADVMLDCAGTLTGWKPVDAMDNVEYLTFDLVKGNFAKQGTCDNGRHVAESAAPFGLTVWGWGTNESTGYMSEAVSYAYPAGQSVHFINTVSVQVN